MTSALSAQLQQQDVRRDSDHGGDGGTSNVAAFDSLLRGKDLFDRAIDEASDRTALAHFDAAITADPRYALAHAARSRILTVIGNQYDEGEQRIATYREAIAAAQRGASLAPEVAETQSALGFALFNGRLDARAARAPYERSLALGGGDADVLSRYALYSARCGRIGRSWPSTARRRSIRSMPTQRLIGDVEYSAPATPAIPPMRRARSVRNCRSPIRRSAPAC